MRPSGDLFPTPPGLAGAYSLQVDTALEDVAGNRVGRPFEVDTLTRSLQNHT